VDLAANLAAATADDFCYLTTRGRRTGEPHEIEIWFALSGTTLYLLSGGGERADWVRNLRAEPAVTVRVRDVTYDATARVAERGTDADDEARARLFEKYQPRYGGSLQQWRGEALAVVVDVSGPEAGQGTR
jgi:deazaflavin-dependent oxidoreductase (nitroreductase family)